MAERAYTLLTSTNLADTTPAVQLARSLHPEPLSSPDAIYGHLHRGTAYVLPALSRYAQAGDRHALLIAAVLMRRQLRAIAAAGGDHDGTDTLTLFWTLIRTAAEPDTLTKQAVAHQLAKRLHGQRATIVVEPCDPHASIFDHDQAVSEPDCHALATQLLDHARAHRIITALEYRTLTVLYLQGIGSLT